MLKSGAEFISPRWQLINKNFLKKVKKYKKKIFPWPIDKEKTMKKFLNENMVEGIITNRIDIVKNLKF